MFKPIFKLSKTGFVATGLFLGLFLALLGWVMFVASRNPADSGESAILLLPFAMPWVQFFHPTLSGPAAGIVGVLLNALIIYCLAGGLRFTGTGQR